MAAGVKLGAEQDVGVFLAWIGVVSGDRIPPIRSHREGPCSMMRRTLKPPRGSTSPSEAVGSRSTYRLRGIGSSHFGSALASEVDGGGMTADAGEKVRKRRTRLRCRRGG